jgi:HSP20 family molecular chaperone IbpA
MSTLFYERNPFDILVRNFFQDASQYSPLDQTKLSHPVDIYTNDKGLIFDVACTGIAKEDIEIYFKTMFFVLITQKLKKKKM